MSNLEIGKRIRTLRTEKGLSREVFCGDEKELTVRQLGRIETGNNLPSLAKLDYIAGVLGIPMSQLIDEGSLIVPKEYLKLKTKLIRQSIHGDEEKVRQREAIFEDIQEHFYYQLPEDEQVAVEVLQAIDDVYVSENAEFGEGLIEEYFNQTLLQTEYSVNDLLILYLYFLSNAISFKRNDDVLKKVRNNIVTIIDCSDNTYMHLLQTVLIAILLYQMRNEYYENISVIFSFLREIMMEIHDSTLKPTVDYFEAKYYLYGEKNKEKALQYYEKAISGAEFFNDINFKNRVIEEMKEEFPDM
ncbi:XRE family transcriptional regulator [Streptococcus mitis]|uniref:helix-turn-helix domain-containing protein n=1 Tax=Streptococcus mitis TaxID=28037 RepID=UPI0039C4087C